MNALTNGVSTVIGFGREVLKCTYTNDSLDALFNGNKLDKDDKAWADTFSLKGRVICLSLTAVYGTFTCISTALAPLILLVSPFFAIVHGFSQPKEGINRLSDMAVKAVKIEMALIFLALVFPVLNGALTLKCLSAAVISPAIHLHS
jgi:hypothetical protein